MLHHWPSWLNRGYRTHLRIFQEMFYHRTRLNRPKASVHCVKNVRKGLAGNTFSTNVRTCIKLHKAKNGSLSPTFLELTCKVQLYICVFPFFANMCQPSKRILSQMTILALSTAGRTQNEIFEYRTATVTKLNFHRLVRHSCIRILYRFCYSAISVRPLLQYLSHHATFCTSVVVTRSFVVQYNIVQVQSRAR